MRDSGGRIGGYIWGRFGGATEASRAANIDEFANEGVLGGFEVVGGAFGDDGAVMEHGDAVGQVKNAADVMANNHTCDVIFRLHLFNKLVDELDHHRI